MQNAVAADWKQKQMALGMIVPSKSYSSSCHHARLKVDSDSVATAMSVAAADQSCC